MDSVLRYEDFSASPHAGAHDLLNFFGMDVDQAVLEFLRESTTKKKGKGAFSTSRFVCSG